MGGLLVIDLVLAVLFLALYAAAATPWVPQPVFLVGLVALFALGTTLWIRAEARAHGLPPLRRAARIVIGVVAVLVGLPIIVLTPLFWLEGFLPAEAGLGRTVPSVMSLLLIALALMVLSNTVGVAIVLGRAALRGIRSSR